jgi:glycosyltransferase involved in cell wall biosynthesis
MRILQVNLLDQRGGAAQVAWNLHRAYRSRGLDAYLAVGRKLGRDQNTFEILHKQYKTPYTRFLLRSGQKLEALSANARGIGLGRLGGLLISATQLQQRWDVFLGREDYLAPGTIHLPECLGGEVDILHLHNLHKDWMNDRRNYFDLRALPVISRRVPVLLTLHDAWLLSGHCAHSTGCERWLSGCGHCPDLAIYPALRRDGTAYNWKRKREIYRQSCLHVIAPSRWLMEKVERSILSEGMVSSRVIPNGVDLSVFHPGVEDRSALGLPLDVHILLFAADGIRTNKMKDFQTLRLAISRVAERIPNVLFVALGEAGPSETMGQAEIRFVPYEKDPRLVARFYRAADLYIHASKADTFPNSVLEAIACGIPVVATHVGGIPEQIREGKTGFLTPPGDPQEMAARIEQLLTDDVLRNKMGKNAAEDACRRFDLNRQVDEYLAIYQEIQRTYKTH